MATGVAAAQAAEIDAAQIDTRIEAIRLPAGCSKHVGRVDDISIDVVIVDANFWGAMSLADAGDMRDTVRAARTMADDRTCGSSFAAPGGVSRGRDLVDAHLRQPIKR